MNNLETEEDQAGNNDVVEGRGDSPRAKESSHLVGVRRNERVSGRRVLGESDQNNKIVVQKGSHGKDKGGIESREISRGMGGMNGRFGKENLRSVSGGRLSLGRGLSSQGSMEVGVSSRENGDGVKSGVVSEYLARMKELGEKTLYNIKNKPPDGSGDNGGSENKGNVPQSRVSSSLMGSDDASMMVD